MDTESKPIQSFIGLRGTISDGKGRGSRATFSLYRCQEFVNGEPEGVSANGVCRVSDGSTILEEFFNAGNPLFLVTDELEATVHLTTSGTFVVIGSIIQKK
jgi:hypothetical protein